MIQIYCGGGKGKTTAALGLCLRATGRGRKCLWTSFLKDYQSGEFMGNMPFHLMKGEPVQGFVWNMDEKQKQALANEHCNRLEEIARCAHQYDVIVLDEVFGALQANALACVDVINFINKLPVSCELVLTGQNPPPEIANLADYISKIVPQKHPYEQGISAREGIEF